MASDEMKEVLESLAREVEQSRCDEDVDTFEEGKEIVKRVLEHKLLPLLEAGRAMADEESNGTITGSIVNRNHVATWRVTLAALLAEARRKKWAHR